MSRVRTVYAVKHKDENIRAASRSGGIFTAVSDIVLENGGVVYGCALNDKFLAEHRRATNKEERNSFRGSKYIQSEIGDTYKQAKEDLKNGLTVLFTGTPCQIDALYNVLLTSKTDISNLLTIDILCHGVPSPKAWTDYINKKGNIDDIESVNFRDKTNFGWRDHVETLTINGQENSSKEFTNLFYSHLILRDSCFSCNYKNTNRVSDITIGDYWKIENNDKTFDDDKGVSLVMLNSNKGSAYFDLCKATLEVKEFPLATSIQPALSVNYSKPKRKEAFWDEYEGDNILELAKKYTSAPPLTKKQLVKKVILYIPKKMLRILGVI